MTYAERRSQFQMQALELELFAIEGRFCPSAFVGWNATPDLAQATWEWPKHWVMEPATCDPDEYALTRWVNAR